MFSIESWQEIFETMGKNKLQTVLTMVSVFFGIFILVILVGFSSGIEKGVKSQFEEDATNRIAIRTRRTTKEYKGLNPGRLIQLRNNDFEEFNEKYEENLEYKTSVYSVWRGQLVYKGEVGNYRVEGAYPDQQFIENQSMLSGRFLNNKDINNLEKVAIIGNQIKEDIFKKTNPIGEYIEISGINFKVIGVYTDPGGRREESRVLIPLTTAQQIFNAGDKVRSLAYTVKMSDNFDEAVALSMALTENFENDIRTKHTISPDDRSAVRVSNTLEEAKKIYGLVATISYVFWFVGIGTIIAGVVGVSNIMLIVVKERTKEIGIRKALGALPSSIIGMILQEAVFITAFAGFLGLFAGVGLLELISPMVDSDFIKAPQVDFKTSIITVFILIIAGVFAGFIPARKAAHIRPIEALRVE